MTTDPTAPTAAFPWLATIASLLVVWVLRSGSEARSRVADRRLRRGRSSWWEGPALVLGSPLHLLRGLPSTLGLALVAGGSVARLMALAGRRVDLAKALECGLVDEAGDLDAALVLLVDLPDLVPAVVARLLPAAAPGALARAAYDGEPGHPVVLGRDHWAGVTATAEGDEGAKAYLRAHRAEVRLVECGDLATGADQDRPVPS